MKNSFKKLITLIVLVFIFIPSFSAVHSQTASLTGYAVLVQLPGIGDTGNNTTNLSLYLPAAFNLIVGIAVALAFVMITFGGVMYATSDAINNKSQGKEYIQNALWGLLLVIASYLILYTINPQILNFDLNLRRPNITPAVVTLGTVADLNPSDVVNDTTVRSSLLAIPGVTINNGPCLPNQTIGCTNVNGLPTRVLTGLMSLTTQNACGCPIRITGGTEGGHKTHGPGNPIVDMSPNVNLNTYVWGSASTPPDGTSKQKVLPNGQRVTFTYETLGGNVRGTSTGAHWHVVFNN